MKAKNGPIKKKKLLKEHQKKNPYFRAYSQNRNIHKNCTLNKLLFKRILEYYTMTTRIAENFHLFCLVARERESLESKSLKL